MEFQQYVHPDNNRALIKGCMDILYIENYVEFDKNRKVKKTIKFFDEKEMLKK